jgi:hypothetical protein
VKDLYRVETRHDETGFYALAEIQNALYETDHNRKLMIAGCACIVAGTALLALARQSAIAFVPIIIGCWILSWQRARGKTRAKQMTESMKGRDPTVAYRFGPDGFHIKNAQQQGRALYDAIVKIAEHDGYYFLFINESTAHLFRKTDFTLGDPETFTDFIEGKTGLRMKYH